RLFVSSCLCLHLPPLPSLPTRRSSDLFPLHTIAKFLDALLQLLFVAHAEILRASLRAAHADRFRGPFRSRSVQRQARDVSVVLRSEEHTSELQSPDQLVCPLLPVKTKQ